MLGLLREVRNFVLYRIHGCVVQQSLNENMIFVLYCFRKSFQAPYQRSRIMVHTNCQQPKQFSYIHILKIQMVSFIKEHDTWVHG